MHIVDVSDPSGPAITGTSSYFCYSHDVAVQGDYAFALSEPYSLLIFDVSNPADPVRESTLNVGGSEGVAVSGYYAYVACQSGGVKIVDWSDPANPFIVGSYDTPGSANDVFVSGDYAFVADGDEGFLILDISNPANPLLTGKYNSSGDALDIYAQGDYVYLAENYYFSIFDCSQAIGGGGEMTVTLTPVNPPITIPAAGGSFNFDLLVENTGSSAQPFDIWIETVLPGGSTYGPIVLREGLVLPAFTSVSREDLTQNVPGFAASGIYQYRAKVGSHPLTVWAEDSFTFEKLGTNGSSPTWPDWSLDGWEESAVGAADQPAEFGLSGACPNPFNASTIIGYTLPAAGRVRLTVYDIAGRKVTELIDGWRDAGAHEVVFDAGGLAAGMYLCRLEANGFSQQLKVVYLK